MNSSIKETMRLKYDLQKIHTQEYQRWKKLLKVAQE